MGFCYPPVVESIRPSKRVSSPRPCCWAKPVYPKTMSLMLVISLCAGEMAKNTKRTKMKTHAPTRAHERNHVFCWARGLLIAQTMDNESKRGDSSRGDRAGTEKDEKVWWLMDRKGKNKMIERTKRPKRLTHTQCTSNDREAKSKQQRKDMAIRRVDKKKNSWKLKSVSPFHFLPASLLGPFLFPSLL